MKKKVIGVDLDGTLANYSKWGGVYDIGDPIPKMVDRVRRWIAERKPVVIFTARVGGRMPMAVRRKMVDVIQDWTKEHLGKRLPVTAEKTPDMLRFYDDRAVGVERNTGELKS